MADTNIDSSAEQQIGPAKRCEGRAKRLLVACVVVLFALGIIAAGAYVILMGSESVEESAFTYAPWPDLSEHYDLSSIEVVDTTLCHFNSFVIAQNGVPFLNDRIQQQQYEATVLGTGVWIRSYPELKNRRKRCQVRSGDKLTVLRSIDFNNGKHWHYVKLASGRRAGTEGYISSDDVIEQNRYDMLERYVFVERSNLNEKSPKKYLHAVAAVLLKLGAEKDNVDLDVAIIDTSVFEKQSVVTFQISNRHLASNASMIAVVQFYNDNDDFMVLGIVPGQSINRVELAENGSYDVYYY